MLARESEVQGANFKCGLFLILGSIVIGVAIVCGGSFRARLDGAFLYYSEAKVMNFSMGSGGGNCF